MCILCGFFGGFDGDCPECARKIELAVKQRIDAGTKEAIDNFNAFEKMKDHLCACTQKPKETEDQKEIRKLMVSYGCNECRMLRDGCHVNCIILKEKIASKKEAEEQKPKEKICAKCKWCKAFVGHYSWERSLSLYGVESPVHDVYECAYLPSEINKQRDDFCSKFEEK